ncbi:MAG: hypothetical protein IPK63_19105 [Candidatus Competibacteraceae bacterium]|nr:hypothetical protein [Candidatus Competibacteraceae bacterium]
MKKQKHPKYPRSSDGKEWRQTLKVGDRARKVGGSYQATGTILAIFITRDEEQRFVFDFDEPPGLLHIFGPAQIEPMDESSK